MRQVFVLFSGFDPNSKLGVFEVKSKLFQMSLLLYYEVSVSLYWFLLRSHVPVLF